MATYNLQLVFFLMDKLICSLESRVYFSFETERFILCGRRKTLISCWCDYNKFSFLVDNKRYDILLFSFSVITRRLHTICCFGVTLQWTVSHLKISKLNQLIFYTSNITTIIIMILFPWLNILQSKGF